MCMSKFVTSNVWSHAKSSYPILESENLSFFNSKSNVRLRARAKIWFLTWFLGIFSDVSFTWY